MSCAVRAPVLHVRCWVGMEKCHHVSGLAEKNDQGSRVVRLSCAVRGAAALFDA